ncbi:MAG: sugar phosphate isomerase/epimerase [Pirellulaceae bacterium]|nr:sugar phosphate isomerase/epimerase [Pirellulaceae bacterium]
MQLGFVTAIVPELSLPEVLQLAAQIGYDCVEVMCWPPSKADRRYAGVTHIDVTQLSDSAIAEINQLQHSTGVKISGLGYYPNCLSANLEEAQAAVEHLRRVMQAAPRLGLQNVNTFIGRDHRLSVEDNWPRLLDTWGPLMELADSLNLKVGIENCPMLFSKDEWPGGKNIASNPEVWSRLFRDISSPNLGLNFDPSHMVWQVMDYLSAVRNFGNRIWHTHAKDATLDRHRLNEVGLLAYPPLYHTPKLPGLGEVNWGAFIATLLDSGFRGAMCVEVEDRAYEGSLADRKASLVQSYRYLKNFIP